MRAGEFADGTRTLRAKIDMASGNINLRDPALYRIKHVEHQNTGDEWPIYPMYDYAHALGDAVEGITHSLCTLEFEDHRPLYDWCVDKVDLAGNPDLLEPLVPQGLPKEAGKPRQIEFSRLNFNYLVMSKRKLLAMVEDRPGRRLGRPAHADPAGHPPPRLHAVRAAPDGRPRRHQQAELAARHLDPRRRVRDDLDAHAPRRMAVIDPLKVVLTNLADDHEESLTFSNHPKDATQGERQIPFSRELWIEREDFEEMPPPGFKRLTVGGDVRLRGAGIVRCDEVVKDAAGRVVELRCTLDPDSRPGMEGANRKVKGTIHWVSAMHAMAAEIRLYDRLFTVPNPDDDTRTARPIATT
jgi:glutaminyl-tRNA synthetase